MEAACRCEWLEKGRCASGSFKLKRNDSHMSPRGERGSSARVSRPCVGKSYSWFSHGLVSVVSSVQFTASCRQFLFLVLTAILGGHDEVCHGASRDRVFIQSGLGQGAKCSCDEMVPSRQFLPVVSMSSSPRGTMLSWAMCTVAFGTGLHGFQRGAFREDLRVEDGRGQRQDDEASVGDN